MAHGDYETDIVGWSEDQAARLRRIASGERPNDVGTVDWPNLIEEIEDVGERERRAVMSHLQMAMLRVLKAYAWPDHRDRGHWLAEASTALANMRRAVDPGMRQRLDLAEAYADARESAELEQVDGPGPLPLPRAIPLTFDDIAPKARLGALELLGRVAAARAAEEQGGAAP